MVLHHCPLITTRLSVTCQPPSAEQQQSGCDLKRYLTNDGEKLKIGGTKCMSDKTDCFAVDQKVSVK